MHGGEPFARQKNQTAAVAESIANGTVEEAADHLGTLYHKNGATSYVLDGVIAVRRTCYGSEFAAYSEQ